MSDELIAVPAARALARVWSNTAYFRGRWAGEPRKMYRDGALAIFAFLTASDNKDAVQAALDANQVPYLLEYRGSWEREAAIRVLRVLNAG